MTREPDPEPTPRRRKVERTLIVVGLLAVTVLIVGWATTAVRLFL